MMKGILSGLREMHSKRIMHRDIKPENILFREKNAYSDENNICIADFGLATTQNVQKYLFFRCGTPGYIAPEVLNITDPYEKYSEKCDVFSAGAIMFQL
jgi:serine/threonine protein kinase